MLNNMPRRKNFLWLKTGSKKHQLIADAFLVELVGTAPTSAGSSG
jgi:hypothetical protein